MWPPTSSFCWLKIPGRRDTRAVNSCMAPEPRYRRIGHLVGAVTPPRAGAARLASNRPTKTIKPCTSRCRSRPYPARQLPGSVDCRSQSCYLDPSPPPLQRLVCREIQLAWPEAGRRLAWPTHTPNPSI
jgi:hypothetical protein